MAVDQALLDLVTQPVVRLYRWETPTLSLGYFQATVDSEQHLESRGCPVLRRSTGGGAIMHDFELTYSLILPAELVQSKTSELYDRVHRTVAAMLAEVGLTALLHPSRPTVQEPIEHGRSSNSSAVSVQREPFLCFQRRAVGDLILWPNAPTSGTHSADTVLGHKILGSAQRKRDGAVLQHGSILFQQSPRAPQLLGINDFLPTARRCDAMDFGLELIERFMSQFGWVWESSCLTDQETNVAQDYEQTRFSSPAWNALR